MITTVGTHLYFGGFQLGMQAQEDVRFLGSFETWVAGIRARLAVEAAGMSLHTFLPAHAYELPRARLVCANPPCSRYSSMSVSAFSSEDQRDVRNFCEFREVFWTVERTGARALWWETGPLMWSSGREMARGIHEELERVWGEPVTTCVIKYDPRIDNVPQRRPRCHLLHLAGRQTIDVDRTTNWTGQTRAHEWIWNRLGLQGVREDEGLHQVPPRNWHKYGFDSVAECIEFSRDTASFMATIPRWIDEDALWTNAVLSGRALAWSGRQRWLSLEEYGALMGYPAAHVLAAEDARDSKFSTLSLISKSVSADAASGVWRRAFSRAVHDQDDVDDPNREPIQWHDLSMRGLKRTCRTS